MRKREELSNPASCMSRAHDDEMTFVLLGRDPAARVAIESWIEERIRIGKNKRRDPQIQEATASLALMAPAQMLEERKAFNIRLIQAALYIAFKQGLETRTGIEWRGGYTIDREGVAIHGISSITFEPLAALILEALAEYPIQAERPS